MKKKLIPVVALTSILTLGVVATTLTSCNNTQQTVEVTAITLSLSKTSGKVGETITATVTINPTDATDKTFSLTSSDTSKATIEGTTITLLQAGTVTITATSTSGAKTDSKTITIEEDTVAVESVTLTLDKTSIEVGQTANTTVAVLPTNATNKNYTLTVDDSTKASLNTDTGVITALAEGTVNVTVKTADGNKTDTKVLTITPVVADPTITIAGDVKELTVAAGADLTLPVATATDYDHTDLTSEIIIEDYNDTKSISSDKTTFNSLIAGDHTISYYVESTTTRYAEKLITIHVTAATEETFDLEGKTNPAALGTYGEFRENFSKGTNSPLYKGLNDSARSSKISGTSDAISGNSLIIDFNKTAGSEANSLLIGSFSDAMLRNTKVTYTVNFDYKVISGSQSACGDVYFGARYDGFTGINTAFVDNVDGETHHVSFKFPEFAPPETVNAGFFFFKFSPSSEDVIIAVDNFSFKAERCAETTTVKPTLEQLSEESGFTFNWADKSSSFQQGEVVVVENISDEAIKSAIQAKDTFGTNVMHLTGADGHGFSGLDATNLKANDILTIDFDYYSVNDRELLVLPMASGVQSGALSSGKGLEITTVEGNIKHFTLTYKIISGVDSLNFYPANNKNFDIYVGNLTCKLTADEEPVDRTATPLGHHVGDSWSNTSRQWGNKTGDFSVTSMATPETVSGEGIGETVSKFALAAGKGNLSAEWYQPAGQQIEVNQTYEIELVYYVENIEEGQRFMINFDNNDFHNLPTTPGYHKETIKLAPAKRTVDFFSFYFKEVSTNEQVVYIASTKVTLTKIYLEDTLLGYKRGQSWTNTTRVFGPKDDENITITNNFATPESVTGEGIGETVTKFELKAGKGNYTAEWYRPAGQEIEVNQTYEIEVVYYVENIEEGQEFMINFDNDDFHTLPKTPGYHKETVKLAPAKRTVDFFSFYFQKVSTTEQVVYVASTTVTLVDINV